MTSPAWPANVISSRLTEYSLSPRADGASTEMTITTHFDNGVVTVSRYSTETTYHEWGTESVAVIRLENVPPQMKPSEIPVRVHRTLRAGKMHGQLHETLIKGRIEYADGSYRELSHVVGFEHDAARTRLGDEQEERQKLAAMIEEGITPTSVSGAKLILNPLTDFASG